MLSSVFLLSLIDLTIGQKILIVNVVNGQRSLGSKPFNFSQASIGSQPSKSKVSTRDKMNESKDYEEYLDLWYQLGLVGKLLIPTTTTTLTTTTTATITKIPGKWVPIRREQ